jgi:histidine triad (HIT) family protein
MTTRRDLLQGVGVLGLGAAAGALAADAPVADPPPRSNCIFCRIAAGDAPATVVHRDARCVAFATIEPLEPGHLLLAPRGHVRDIYDLSPDLGAHLFGVATGLARAMREVFKPDGLTLRQNTGDAGGQTVFHFHIHLVPRFAGRELWRLVTPPVRRAPAELDAVFAPLADALRGR